MMKAAEVLNRYMAREQGSRDWRLLPSAVSVWAGVLLEHRVFEVWVASEDGMPLPHTVWLLAVPVLLAVVVVSVVLCKRRMKRGKVKRRRYAKVMRLIGRLPPMRGQIVVMVTAGLCAMLAGGLHDMRDHDDVLMQTVRDGGGEVAVAVELLAPMTASTVRGSACQTSVRVLQARHSGVAAPSSAKALLLVSSLHCDWMHGGTYQIRAEAQPARFGAQSIWLTADDAADGRQIRDPPIWRQAAESMRQSFIEVTKRLSQQGQVLVPGLTMGVLGQDAQINGTPQNGLAGEELDKAYAANLEDGFRHAGIMHLMAVSGGHFVLMAALVRWCCARMLLPRIVVTCSMVLVYMMLIVLMYPSDSVLRAAAMGMIGCACLLCGRASQAMSALSWTVMITVILAPDMARSFGFALSCAAVCGIVMFNACCADVLDDYMPSTMAQTMALTLTAQLFTLPVQVLMSAEVPVFAILANMFAAPVVAFATLTGLFSLAVSWLSPTMGFVGAWLASLATGVLAKIAMLLGGSRLSAIQWPEGACGALMLLGVQMACAMFVALVRYGVSRRRKRRHHKDEHGTVTDSDDGGAMTGEPYHDRFMDRVRLWWQETRFMVFGS